MYISIHYNFQLIMDFMVMVGKSSCNILKENPSRKDSLYVVMDMGMVRNKNIDALFVSIPYYIETMYKIGKPYLPIE